MSERFYQGCCISPSGHELRITKRCIEDDLNGRMGVQFEDLVNRHEIVKAFHRERRNVTEGEHPFRHEGSEINLTILRHGHDWRGVTWFDRKEKVVWLCACARHRSGTTRDAYPRFKNLCVNNQIEPVDEDYATLISERNGRFSFFVKSDAPALLVKARAEPEIEMSQLIGLESVSILVVRVETLEEIFVVFSAKNLMPVLVLQLLIPLVRDSTFPDWKWRERLPTRELDRSKDEICLSIVHG